MAPSSREPLRLDVKTCERLLTLFGPSLGLWRAAEVAALRGVPMEAPVLDLGCGDGIVTSLVLDEVAVGVDPDPGPLAHAGERGVYRRLEACAVQEVSLAPGSIRTVLSNSVLEHVSDVDDALQAAARLLASGGYLVMTAPSDTFSSWLALPVPAYATGRNRALQHRNLWTADMWQRRLAAVGLEVTRVEPYLSRRLVLLWDVLEMAQSVWIGRHRLFSLFWQRLSPEMIHRMAVGLASLDLGADRDGGGQLIVARKAAQ